MIAEIPGRRRRDAERDRQGVDGARRADTEWPRRLESGDGDAAGSPSAGRLNTRCPDDVWLPHKPAQSAIASSHSLQKFAQTQAFHSSDTPALRRPAKKVVSNRARIFGTPKYLLALRRPMLV